MRRCFAFSSPVWMFSSTLSVGKIIRPCGT
jgi:hypothetical protein